MWVFLGGDGGRRDVGVVTVLAYHYCGSGLIPKLGVICWLSLLLVLVLAPRGFSPSTPGFPSPQKPTLQNSNLIWEVSPISVMRSIQWHLNNGIFFHNFLYQHLQIPTQLPTTDNIAFFSQIMQLIYHLENTVAVHMTATNSKEG